MNAAIKTENTLVSRYRLGMWVALASLVDRLQRHAFTLLDVQWVTPHLQRFGAIEIPRRRYLKMLDEALTIDASFD